MVNVVDLLSDSISKNLLGADQSPSFRCLTDTVLVVFITEDQYFHQSLLESLSFLQMKELDASEVGF